MSQRNTTQLLNEKATLTIERIEAEFRRHLQPAVDQTALIQRLLQDGVYEIEDKDGLLDLLVGSLASSPQMRGSVSLELEGAEWPAELWYDSARSFVGWRSWG